MTKICSHCKAELPIHIFGRSKNTKDGLASWCKPCWLEWTRRYRANNRERVLRIARECYYRNREKRLAHMKQAYQQNKETHQAYKRKLAYGVTQEQYERLLDSQGGVCALCLKPPKSPCIDHDHHSGSARGVLCKPCNSSLGLAHDNPETLKRMLIYLAVHNGGSFQCPVDGSVATPTTAP